MFTTTAQDLPLVEKKVKMGMICFEIILVLTTAVVTAYQNPVHDFPWHPADEVFDVDLDCGVCSCNSDSYFKCETRNTLAKIPNITSPNFYAM